MSGRPSETELQRRIAELLMTRDAGRAVARRLQDAPADPSVATFEADLPPRRIAAARDPDPEAVVRGYGYAPSSAHRHLARIH